MKTETKTNEVRKKTKKLLKVGQSCKLSNVGEITYNAH